MSAPVLAIDVDGIQAVDLNALFTLIDMTPTHQDVRIYKLSTEKAQAVNAAEVKNLGLPYSDIKFVDFEDYSLRTNDKFDAIMEDGQDIVVLTKDVDLASMLKPRIAGVFVY